MYIMSTRADQHQSPAPANLSDIVTGDEVSTFGYADDAIGADNLDGLSAPGAQSRKPRTGDLKKRMVRARRLRSATLTLTR